MRNFDLGIVWNPNSALPVILNVNLPLGMKLYWLGDTGLTDRTQKYNKTVNANKKPAPKAILSADDLVLLDLSVLCNAALLINK